ncbi:U-box domain-containing protein 17 [Abeliophyllum distichum]|uniref:U-box domain-containing protein 17 n=1 Tax=Abeliophyllum distichum TaxID=126358 RepID=A0ABD1QKN0_9LAMI
MCTLNFAKTKESFSTNWEFLLPILRPKLSWLGGGSALRSGRGMGWGEPVANPNPTQNTGKEEEKRTCIAEAGAIPHLKTLLTFPDAFARENSVTALLNLSIYDKNKSQIMNVEGFLGSIARVLRFRYTIEARKNAVVTLSSLSTFHEYKKRIAEEYGAVEALSRLLEGTPRGKKDVLMALFNLSMHIENFGKKDTVTALFSSLVSSFFASILGWIRVCCGF